MERKRRGPSRESFLKEKDEAFINKNDYKKTKIHRGYGDLLAVERFNIKLNLR